jgi:hypothetical protein
VTPLISDDEAWKSVKRLFTERVFRYKFNGWLTLDKAVMLSLHLEETARRELDQVEVIREQLG